jgi:ArsR family transcriptional regulator, arsenate/arsenite/antimonite-responsive transcriptional repressor
MGNRCKRTTVRNDEECCEIDGKLNLPSSIEEKLEKAGGLESLIENLPTLDELKNRSGMYQILSDSSRLRLLHALARCDLCPCVLKEVVEQSDSKLSYHLNVLEEAGLIESFPEKKWRIYSLTDLGRSIIDQN